MLRFTRCALDSTKAPHKYYKYGYTVDPRKLAPFERLHTTEFKPKYIRPPNKFVPDVATFMDKADHHEANVADFSSTFKSWNDMMTSSAGSMKQRGMTHWSVKSLRTAIISYREGYLPDRFKVKNELQWYKQFKRTNKDNQKRIVPELPEKYRPHQQGMEQPGLPDYSKINQQPEWAAKELERLAAKAV